MQDGPAVADAGSSGPGGAPVLVLLLFIFLRVAGSVRGAGGLRSLPAGAGAPLNQR